MASAGPSTAASTVYHFSAVETAAPQQLSPQEVQQEHHVDARKGVSVVTSMILSV